MTATVASLGRRAFVWARLALVILIVAISATRAHAAIGTEGPVIALSDRVERVLLNGRVRTPDGLAEAVAIGNGYILATGSSRQVAAMADSGTERVDLAGATVLPGLHDVHVHPLLAGLEQFQCAFAPGAAAVEIASAVRACAAKAPPGEWVQGGNWVAAVFAEGEQHKSLLDAVAPDHPVLLHDESHHSAWANSRALAAAGIHADTPDPEGGIIERDRDGEPTGILRERATRLVADIIPAADAGRRREALVLATNQMLAFGITSFTDAYATAFHIGDLAALTREGAVKQRIRACIYWEPGPGEVNATSERLIAAREGYRSERFAADCVKLMLDGVPTESHTAALLEPYADAGADGDTRPPRGLTLMPWEALRTAVARFDREGIHIKFHAVGDAAVRSAIDAVEAARQRNGFGGPAHDVGHNSFVDPADIPRVRALGMAWEFSPYIWYPTPIASVDIRNAVGEERLARFIPIRDAVASGALVTAGSDWSVVPSVNPWLALETMVTRRIPGGGGDTLAPGQRVDLETAFRILTDGGARLMGHRNRTGAIVAGLRADLVVTERDPFAVPVTEVHATRVLQTFVDGVKVFEAQGMQNR